MNKEINKIIANLEGCVGIFDYVLTPTESNLLVSHLKELQQENKQLKAINKEYERLNKENGRGFKITNVQEYNIDELLSCKNYKDNWNKLKEYIISTRYEYGDLDQDLEDYDLEIEDVLNKMTELEQGSD